MALIELRGVTKEYENGEGTIWALRDLNLTVEAGEFLAVVGQSGSGKSTLMNVMGCLDVPSKGEYILGGQQVSGLDDKALSAIRNRTIGFIFQGFNLIPTLNARENVELPLLYRGIGRSERRQRACEALEQVGLDQRTTHRPGQMSGGQQQRVAIARAVAAHPAVILADEPTGNLDREAGESVMGVLIELWQRGRTVVLITHDPLVAARAPRVVELRDGCIISDRRRHNVQKIAPNHIDIPLRRCYND